MNAYTPDERAQGIYTLLRLAIEADPEASDESTAEVVLAGLGVKQSAAVVLRQLLVDEIGRSRRGVVRNIERSARRGTGGDPNDRIDARAELLRSSFVLPDGKFVTWGEATVEQHRERIAMLDKQRSGLTRTISSHEEAIAKCEAAGVSCLNEIEDAA